jgi:hypothetical protein
MASERLTEPWIWVWMYAVFLVDSFSARLRQIPHILMAVPESEKKAETASMIATILDRKNNGGFNRDNDSDVNPAA